ncbi:MULTISPECIES: hypothetical protein [Nostocales]|uniref:Uncharacterized protein n=3 Tax=Nostocales TaxID=1161 RepID=A0A0C1NCC8_9CYAN|nr:hypothetical protein [Tolypothrix bouteillei]KAF3890244.1 hypothetical protein DA73_0400035950 [Tolypothrix bouteillei VB521301]
MKVDPKYSNPNKFWNRLGLTVVTAGVIAGSLSICYLVYRNNFVDQSGAKRVQVEQQNKTNPKVEQYLKYSECLSEGGTEEKCNPLLHK